MLNTDLQNVYQRFTECLIKFTECLFKIYWMFIKNFLRNAKIFIYIYHIKYFHMYMSYVNAIYYVTDIICLPWSSS